MGAGKELAYRNVAKETSSYQPPFIVKTFQLIGLKKLFHTYLEDEMSKKTLKWFIPFQTFHSIPFFTILFPTFHFVQFSHPISFVLIKKIMQQIFQKPFATLKPKSVFIFYRNFHCNLLPLLPLCRLPSPNSDHRASVSILKPPCYLLSCKWCSWPFFWKEYNIPKWYWKSIIMFLILINSVGR